MSIQVVRLMFRCAAVQSSVRTLLVAALVCAMFVTVGCGGQRTSDRDLLWVEVEEAYSLVSTERGGTILGIGAKKTAVWIDPRPEQDYNTAHIPGAINLTLDSVRANDERLRNHDVLIVYGNDYTSALAVAMSKRLLSSGYGDVRTLRGGLRAWVNAGNATSP